MSFDKFFAEEEATEQWGLPVEIERRNRIKLSIAAFAYELEDDPIMSDGDYDTLSFLINKKMDTGNEKLDKFFKKEFLPHTGQWIRRHPELDKIRNLYYKFYYRK